MAQADRILIVDDDPIVGESLAAFCAREGLAPELAGSAEDALKALVEADAGGRSFAIALCDLSLPGMDGMDLVREITKTHTRTAPVVLTGYGTIESAVAALRHGAADYLTKPVIDTELRIALERARQRQTLLAENSSLRTRLRRKASPEGVVGADPRMARVFELVEAVAPSKSTVLMTGESGTGKSLIASAIHERSTRASGPYVEISCGSIPETLLESELFGHVKGAFTGAHADKVGRFQAAGGGTLFLDEINSASQAMQLKLLRVLQERKFEPVGSSETIEADVRVILASNQPLEELVASGQFRQDLYYRINVVKIELPPLRDRRADIPTLAEHFLQEQGEELGRTFAGFAPDALEALSHYAFPGNVRELQNIVERAAVLARGQTIERRDLPPHVLEGDSQGLMRDAIGYAPEPEGAEPGEWVPRQLSDALREPERRIILQALRANAWNRQQTADDLGINRTTLYKKMKALGIDDEQRESA
ncbi:MAG: sigma-54-dependent transcriptional regulator [Phycisphaerales bacterium JB059]